MKHLFLAIKLDGLDYYMFIIYYFQTGTLNFRQTDGVHKSIQNTTMVAILLHKKVPTLLPAKLAENHNNVRKMNDQLLAAKENVLLHHNDRRKLMLSNYPKHILHMRNFWLSRLSCYPFPFFKGTIAFTKPNYSH